MKNKVYTLIITGLVISSCGTANLYTSSGYDDAIYNLDPDKAVALSTATNRELLDLKTRTAEAEQKIIKDKNTEIIYFDENGVANIPVDPEKTFIVLDSTMSYEELLRKFESPDFTINLYLRDNRMNDNSYYDTWRLGFNPWRYRSYGSYWDRYFYYNWAYGGYYSPYYWSMYGPFYYDYYDLYYSPFWAYSPYYSPWFMNRYYDRWYGNWGGYYGDSWWYSGGGWGGNHTATSSRSYYTGKRKSAFGEKTDRNDNRYTSENPRNQGTVERISAGRVGMGDSRTSNSMYRKTDRMNTSSDPANYSTYSGRTGQTREGMRQSGTTGTSQSSYKRSSTGITPGSSVRSNTENSGTNYRRSTTSVGTSSVGARNSGNSFNSTTYRRGSGSESSTGTRNATYNTERSGSSDYSRSSSSSTATRAVSSGTNSGSSSSSSGSSTSSSSGSAYRR
ncbi:MAG: hypothetical protein CVT97_03975 [Bacteroidetes bacterium HGW-Bacteroidetes-14]|jgi:hypothetical protein|nr:MAG: hypothetical protein CVT97_03975 [Bacteroidetes bacterium HGW-Bacteroidetes-14]